MTTFFELVIAPAVLPWLIVLITDLVENWLDRQQGTDILLKIERPEMGGHSA